MPKRALPAPLKSLIGLILFTLAVISCNCPGSVKPGEPFTYAVLVQDESSHAALAGAKATIYVENLASISELTDNNGYARFQVPATHSGKPGRLKVELQDHKVYDIAIDLLPARLPNVIPLASSKVTGPAVAGRWRQENRPISIGGKLFDSYGYIDSESATLSAQDWEGFTGLVGISDETSENANSTVTFTVDGRVVKEVQVNHGEPPVQINIPLRGNKELMITRSRGDGLVIANPRWLSRAEARPAPTPGREELRLGSKTRVAAGSWRYYVESTTINSTIVKPFGALESAFVTFDVEGWDYFDGLLGMSDEASSSANATVNIKLDGDEAGTYQLNYGDPPVRLHISLKGHRALTFRPGRSSSYIVLGEPKLTRGN